MKRLMMILLLVLPTVLLLVLLLPSAFAQEPDLPPASYAVVAETYTELEAQTVSQAEAVLAQFWKGELEAMYAQFDDTFKALITLEQLESSQRGLLAAGEFGERLDHRVIPAAGFRTYIGLYEWGTSQIIVVVSFNASDQIGGLNFQLAFPLPDDPLADYQGDVTYRLPFDGLWYVGWGGDTPLRNYHVVVPAQRHAYDILIWKDGSTYRGDGTRVEDYYVYGQPVLAPAAGDVIKKVDGLPDVEPQVGSDTVNLAGNYVIIQTAASEYLLIAHLMPDSVRVEVGDHVEAGQVIGRVGNSGNTTEPHIHIHLQNGPEFFSYDDAGTITGLNEDVLGVPLRFSNYLANGEWVDTGVPLGGLFVQNAE